MRTEEEQRKYISGEFYTYSVFKQCRKKGSSTKSGYNVGSHLPGISQCPFPPLTQLVMSCSDHLYLKQTVILQIWVDSLIYNEIPNIIYSVPILI